MISELYSVFSEMDFFCKFFFCFVLFILALFVCCFFIGLIRISPEEAEEKYAKIKREAEEEEKRLKRHAEEAEAERTRTQSQIWVI